MPAGNAADVFAFWCEHREWPCALQRIDETSVVWSVELTALSTLDFLRTSIAVPGEVVSLNTDGRRELIFRASNSY